MLNIPILLGYSTSPFPSYSPPPPFPMDPYWYSYLPIPPPLIDTPPPYSPWIFNLPILLIYPPPHSLLILYLLIPLGYSTSLFPLDIQPPHFPYISTSPFPLDIPNPHSLGYTTSYSLNIYSTSSFSPWIPLLPHSPGCSTSWYSQGCFWSTSPMTLNTLSLTFPRVRNFSTISGRSTS